MKTVSSIALLLLASIILLAASPQEVIIARRRASAGPSAPTYGTSSRGGDAFACFHTLTCATGSISVTSGQPVVVGIVEEGATSITGISGTANCNGTYTQRQTVSNPAPATLRLYTTVATGTGSCTVTATYVGASTYSRLFAVPITGANVSTPIGNSASQSQTNTGTGANAVSSSNFSTTTSNNLVVSWVCDVQGITGTFTAGTSPISSTLDFSNYDGGNFTCAAERGTVASASTVSGTFTEGTGGATNQSLTAGVAIQP